MRAVGPHFIYTRVVVCGLITTRRVAIISLFRELVSMRPESGLTIRINN